MGTPSMVNAAVPPANTSLAAGEGLEPDVDAFGSADVVRARIPALY